MGNHLLPDGIVPLTDGNQLIALPATNRRALCAIGDSYTTINANSTGGANNTAMCGALTTLNVLAGWAFDFSNTDNFSGPAYTLPLLITNCLPKVLAGSYSFCVVQGCHNDFIFAGRTMEQVAADYQTICNVLIRAGITPIIVLGPSIDTNEGSPYFTLAQVQKLTLQANVWKRNHCESQGIPVWDWATAMNDLTASGTGFAAGFTSDTIHPNILASFAAAKQGLLDLAAILPPSRRNCLQAVSNDTYDATFNPYGNLLTGGGLFWAGGGTHAGRSTGTVANNLTLFTTDPAAGGAVVASLVASSDGIGQWQQIEFSGTTTEGSDAAAWMLFEFISQADLYAVGDVIESWVEVSVLANSPFTGISLALIEQNNDGSQVRNVTGFFQPAAGNPDWPTYAWMGILKTAPLTVPTNTTTGSRERLLWPQLGFYLNGSANNFAGTVRFRRWTVRKVPQF